MRGATSRKEKLRGRVRIDAAFAEMATDIEYQKEALQMAEEFSRSDWEAFELGTQPVGRTRSRH